MNLFAFDVDISKVRTDLIECKKLCEFHFNKTGVEWATGLLVSISDLLPDASSLQPQESTIFVPDRYYYRVKNLLHLGEHQRAAFLVKNLRADIHKYAYYYSRYLSIEAERLSLSAESDSHSSGIIRLVCQKFSELSSELEADLKGSTPTSWLCYVSSLIYLKLNKQDQARDNLIESVCLNPLNWPAWEQLTSLILDKHHLKSLTLPSHWFKLFFLGSVYNRLQMYEEAHDLYTNILSKYFSESVYVLGEIAKAENELRDVEAANETFKKVRTIDPFRLDDMDVCSNALYVSQKVYELASLAHTANEIEPYRLETCFCLANFYSLRGQHDKAATYFSRALKLDPTNISAWILMGHEFMEMKSTEDAIQAYRSAINLDRTDHRAWYGLGQLYEILKLPNISLDNYLEAHKLKPNDSRIVTALKEIFEKLGWFNQAQTYHRRARQEIDFEESAII